MIELISLITLLTSLIISLLLVLRVIFVYKWSYDNQKKIENKNILLIIAHPDDESM